MKKIFILFCLLRIQYANAQTLLTGMPLPNASVYAIEKVDSTVYIGGSFSQVNAIPRSSVAAFNASTGALNSWNPVVSGGVTSITRVGPKLIIGGTFTSVNSQPRYGIGMFDLATGNLDSWSDTVNYISWRQGVGVYNNNFYYARRITASTLRIVCVDALTGNFTSWQSDSLFGSGGDMNAIYASGTHVYVGGMFSFSGGSSVYSNLCRFSQTTGALDTSWHPQPNVMNFGITSIVKTNSNIFVGGDYSIINGVSRKGVAAYDMNGNLTGFNQNSSSYEVISLFADGNYIWVGGNSSTLGGQLRYRIAQIRISNATATCWNASATSSAWSTVSAIYVSGDTVYAAPVGSPQLSVFAGTPLPQPAGDSISGPDSVVAMQVAAYSVPFVSGHTYNWSITGGSGSSTTNSINVTWGSGPNGTVRVVENNPSASNCYSDTITQQVAISFTTFGDAYEDTRIKNFSVFPNPVTKELRIKNTELRIEKVEICNVYGEKIFSQRPTANSWQLTVNVSDFNPGIYFIKVKGDQQEQILKFVKQ